MKTKIRDLKARALYPTKAFNLPAVWERYGLEPRTDEEAFSSKTQYVMRRLQRLSDKKVFAVAKNVVADFPDDALSEKRGRSAHRR